MLSSAAAVGFLQANFKRTFENAEKEVEVAINQLIRLSGGSFGTTEKCDAQKKVSNALSEIKKQVTKFNSSALFFIGLNIDPMNPQLHKLLMGSGDDLFLPKSNGKRPKRKKEQSEQERVKGIVSPKIREKQGVASVLVEVRTKQESGEAAQELAKNSSVAAPVPRKAGSFENSGRKRLKYKNTKFEEQEKYSEEEMKRLLAELSSSSDNDGPEKRLIHCEFGAEADAIKESGPGSCNTGMPDQMSARGSDLHEKKCSLQSPTHEKLLLSECEKNNGQMSLLEFEDGEIFD